MAILSSAKRSSSSSSMGVVGICCLSCHEKVGGMDVLVEFEERCGDGRHGKAGVNGTVHS